MTDFPTPPLETVLAAWDQQESDRDTGFAARQSSEDLDGDSYADVSGLALIQPGINYAQTVAQAEAVLS